MEMDKEMIQNSLDEILRKQIQTVSSLYSCQKRMYAGVTGKDWSALLSETAFMEECADVFAVLENRRVQLLTAASGKFGVPCDFYAVTALFQEEKRRELNSLLRELKRILVLSKTENEIFTGYVDGAQKMLSSLLENIVPSRRNKIYTRSGNLASGPGEGFVLNRAF